MGVLLNKWIIDDSEYVEDEANVISPTVHSFDENEVRYLCTPGVAVIGVPMVIEDAMRPFLRGLGPEYDGYIDQPRFDESEGEWTRDSDLLVQLAGQSCYGSFRPGKSTPFSENKKYIDNIMESGHFSVFHHANISLFLWGISRSVSHELVRHNFISPSQLSQRYVNERALRFVERPEFQHDPNLHSAFLRRCQQTYEEYVLLSRRLANMDMGTEDMSRTDQRKHVQQAARAVLTNEVETWMVATANTREWRHFLALRGAEHAETEIRILAARIAFLLKQEAPNQFSDVEICDGPDGYPIVGVKNHGAH